MYPNAKTSYRLFSALTKRVIGLITLSFAFFCLQGVAQAEKVSVAVIPFVSTNPKADAETFAEISTKLEKQLKKREIEVKAITSEGATVEIKLPNESSFKDAERNFREGKAMLRKKKAKVAQARLERALELYEESLVHIKNLETLIELHRLLALTYLRLGMNEQAEQVINRLAYLESKA